MALGRPSEYDPNYIDQVETYIQSCGREQMELPTVEGFARFIGVNTDTINNWATKKDDKGELLYPDFFRAIKELKDVQKVQLMNDGMYGGKEVNSTMAIFLLKANHGMIETERKELTGADGEKLTIVIGEGNGNKTT